MGLRLEIWSDDEANEGQERITWLPDTIEK